MTLKMSWSACKIIMTVYLNKNQASLEDSQELADHSMEQEEQLGLI